MRFLITLSILAAPLAAQPPIRVGVYDSRAIAVAYTHSGHFQNLIHEKKKELEAAKAAGDTARAKALDDWGQAQQRQLHRQGFSRVPVGELLIPVRDRLPEAAARAGVQVIAAECDYSGPGVVVVDITDELVRLYDPSPRVLSIVKDMRAIPPLSLNELEKLKH